MIVIVCGSRDYAWDVRDERWLDTQHAQLTLTEVVVGSLDGADGHAYDWARRNGITRTLMDANWVGHGKGGGPRRNQRMLDYLYLRQRATGPDIAVLAFPGGTGTADMVRRAQQAGVLVLRPLWQEAP